MLEKNIIVSKLYDTKLLTCPTYQLSDAENAFKNFMNNIKNKKLIHFNKHLAAVDKDENGIPKIIHLTCKNKNCIEEEYKTCLKKIEKMYHDYEIIIYDNNDIYNIIQFFDPKKLDLIGQIKIGAVLADIFRYLILYLRGGYYFDMDCEPIKHIKYLSHKQYHGNNENYFKIKKNSKINDTTCEFLTNICDNCKLVNRYDKYDLYMCYGHNYINNDTKIILGYEFNDCWHKNTEYLTSKWTHNEIGITQWFMGSVGYQPIFLYCYKKALKRTIKYIVNNLYRDIDYHYKIINSTGPLFFTKMIDEFSKKDSGFKHLITIFPPDYFCFGSGNIVPSTKNCFVKHKYVGSWLK